MSRNAESFEGTSTLQGTDREQPGGGKAVWRMQGKTSPELCQGILFLQSDVWRWSENRGNDAVPRVKGSMSENQGGTV